MNKNTLKSLENDTNSPEVHSNLIDKFDAYSPDNTKGLTTLDVIKSNQVVRHISSLREERYLSLNVNLIDHSTDISDVFPRVCELLDKDRKRGINKERYMRAYRVLIANLALSNDRDLKLCYSRDKSNPWLSSKNEQYSKFGVKHDVLITLIDTLMECKYLEGKKGLFNFKKQLGAMSSIDKVNENMCHHLNIENVKDYSPAIQLRTKCVPDKQKPWAFTRWKFLSYEDSQTTENLIQQVEEYNQYLSGLEIKELEENRSIRYHRVFNGSLEAGGRFFSSFTQLPDVISEDGWLSGGRLCHTINGEQLVGIDFGSFMPTLLYALSGHSLLSDAYEIDGLTRKQAKKLFILFLNVGSKGAVTKAFNEYLRVEGLDPDTMDTSFFMQQLADKHKCIAEYFFCKKGLVSQRYESEITEIVLAKFNALKAPVLPVHDAYYTTEKYAKNLCKAMYEAFCEVTKGMTPILLKKSILKGENKIETLAWVDNNTDFSSDLEFVRNTKLGYRKYKQQVEIFNPTDHAPNLGHVFSKEPEKEKEPKEPSRYPDSCYRPSRLIEAVSNANVREQIDDDDF